MTSSRIMTWRERSWRHVQAAVAEGEARGLDGKDLEKFVRSEYPFGIREHWPYKVWCDVVKEAFGRRQTRRRKPPQQADPGQGNLFS